VAQTTYNSLTLATLHPRKLTTAKLKHKRVTARKIQWELALLTEAALLSRPKSSVRLDLRHGVNSTHAFEHRSGIQQYKSRTDLINSGISVQLDLEVQCSDSSQAYQKVRNNNPIDIIHHWYNSTTTESQPQPGRCAY
jgi:hypothetical protein